MAGFYKSKYDNKNKYNYWLLKDGDQAYRIVPALNEDRVWHKFITTHFGYKDSAGKMRTFQGVEVKNYKTKMIEVPDAAAERLVRLSAQLDEEKKKGPAGDKDLIQKLTKLVGSGSVMGQYNLDKKQYIYVYDTQGNVGCLKLSYRAFLSLKAAIDRYKSENEGADPLDPENGVYFNFNRTGIKLDTTVQVSPLQHAVKENGKSYKQDVVHAIPHTPEQIVKMIRGFENEVRLLSPEQIGRIVKEGAKAIDEIFGASEVEASKPEPQEIEETETPAGEDLPAELSLEEEEEEAPPVKAAPKPLAAVTKSAPVKPVPAVKPASNLLKTTAQAIAEQSDDDFLNSL